MPPRFALTTPISDPPTPRKSARVGWIGDGVGVYLNAEGKWQEGRFKPFLEALLVKGQTQSTKGQADCKTLSTPKGHE